MLNFVAFYGALVIFALGGIMLGFSVKWIVEAYQLNRRANQQAQRYLNAPLTSNVAPWGRKAGR